MPEPVLSAAVPPPAVGGLKLRAFGDVSGLRDDIASSVLQGLTNRFPIENERYRLELSDLQHQSKSYTIPEQKDAILRGKTLTTPVKGAWQLIDKATGEAVDRARRTVTRVPYINQQGTYIYNGHQYTISNQARLRPGVYTRQRESGELETHFNVKPGTGRGFRILLEPDTGIFRMHVGQAKLRLLPILRRMGMTDAQLRAAWGNDLFAANAKKDDTSAYQKAVARLGNNRAKSSAGEQIEQSLLEILAKSELNEDVTEKTLGKRYRNVTPEVLSRATSKLIGVSKGEEDVDDRDSMEFQELRDASDLFRERIERDAGMLARRLLWRASYAGNLKSARTGYLADQLQSAIYKSGLGSCYDSETFVLTKRGFVRWGDVTETDEFACRINGCVEYHKPLRLIREWYSGPMVGVKTKVVDYLVTPNHRCHARFDHHKGRKSSSYRTVRADALAGRSFHLNALLGLPHDTSEDDIQLSSINKRHGHRMTASIPAKSWAPFLGWWMAEGSVSKWASKKQPGSTQYSVQLAQSEPDGIRSITKILDALPFNYHYSDKNKQFHISDKCLYEELLSYGSRCTSKRIPRYVFSWPVELIESFYCAYMAGDGNSHKGYDKSSTASFWLAMDLVELSGRLSKTGRISVRKKDKDNWSVEHVVSYSGKRDEVFVSSSKRAAAQNKPDPHYAVDYAGEVFCAEVPGGMLHVLRNGKPHWSCNSLEEINPTEIMDRNLRVIRLGEGGISSVDSVPESSRNVQPSQFSVIDPIISPESMKIGIDLRTAINSYKGSDGQIYSSMFNIRTGEEEKVSARDLANAVVAFPGEMDKGRGKVRAMNRGQLDRVPRNQVDYALPHASEMFTAGSNLVPMISAIKGQRLMMGARMANQALPLSDPESPLVQSEARDGSSFERKYGTQAGAIRADMPGRVTVMDKNGITVRQSDGTDRTYELYDNFPYNRKTYQHNTPNVAVGDIVRPGDLLARSNYTDADGTLALGKNMRVAYLPWKGNFEDAIVVSESAAKRFSSEHMYSNELELEEGINTGRDEFSSLFPTKYSKDQLGNLDRSGVVKSGATIKYGDPLILASKARKSRPGDHLFRRKMSDHSVDWDYQHDGVVTDVIKDKEGVRVFVKSISPMEVGDKMSGRYGDKGVVREIVPDDQMPKNKDGVPVDVVLNPLGIITRVNPAQLYEAALGKIAAKRGVPYIMPAFVSEDLAGFVEKELKQHGMKDTEDLTDPETGKRLKDVFVGNRFFMKLHHTAESKESARDIGAYTMDMAPAKGGKAGAKRIGGMEMNALVSHGASEVIRDIKNVRGQRNDDFWKAFRLGYSPPTPQIPHAYEKFLAMLQAAGVNVQKKGSATHIMALTDKDIDTLSGGEVTSGGTVDFNNFEPVPGGLFDRKVFGGRGGRSWGHVTLSEPMPNPIMEEVVRRMLGLTKNKFRDVMSGKEELNGFVGTEAITQALRKINVKDEIESQRRIISSGRKSNRDAAVKKLGFLKMMQKTGLRPEEMVLSRVPVLPTAFRPVSAFKDMNLVTDANFLYKDLIEANDAYKDIVGELGREHSGDERLALYDAFKAVAGLGDPIKAETQQKRVRGMLAQVFGGSPKFGMFQRQVIASPVDIVGRATVTPDPALDMDHVGLPEEKAWTIYRPFVIRRMVRAGVPAVQAVRMVMNKEDRAKRALVEEMSVRPVIVNRNPTLHKYGIMAAFPTLVRGRTLRVSPIVVGGFGMDFDGDAAQYHVPVGEQARREAIEKMLPSKNLLSQSDFEVHYIPKNEYALGLYLASSTRSRKGARTFRTPADVAAAFMRGDIDLDTVVDIPERDRT